MKKSKKKSKFLKLEFVKQVYIINLIFVFITTVATFVAVFLSGYLCITDLSPISTICSCAWVELGTFSSFYCWKSKCENLHKYPSVKEKLENIELEIMESEV